MSQSCGLIQFNQSPSPYSVLKDSAFPLLPPLIYLNESSSLDKCDISFTFLLQDSGYSFVPFILIIMFPLNLQ